MASAGEQLMERITKLPVPQKVAIVAAVVLALCAGNYFLFVQPLREDFDRQVKQMHNLEEEVIQAQAIANNLNQFRKEKELLEQQLAKALTELPNDANLPELIKSLYELAQKAGLAIINLDPLPEKGGDQGLYAEIPLSMSVRGSFEEIGVFFDAVRQLKRIVNIKGIKMSSPRIKNDQVLVDASYQATSFRFVPQAADKGKGKGKDDKGGKDEKGKDEKKPSK